MINQAFTETRFTEFKLNPLLLTALEKAGFTHCTPIQKKCIPHILDGRDVAGQAQTGTGKTLAFLVGTFERLLNSEVTEDEANSTHIRAIIVAPTRELAIQIHSDAEKINEVLGLKLGLAYGGVDYEKQRTQLENGCDVLIGTPGRIIDYFKQKVFSLGRVEVAVLDEADRMFDLGFIKDIRFLFNKMPAPTQRLNLLFSATLSHRVQELAYVHMEEPVHVEIEAENITADRINQTLYMPSADEKIPLLIGLMRKIKPERTVVFTNMKATAETVHDWLNANDYTAALLSGDIPQKKRQRLLEDFKDGKRNVLVATDVAARGLHIDGVTHVFNYDLPNEAEDYVHRIGRTARAGSEGVAISFACDYSAMNLPAIEEYIERKIENTPLEDSDFALDLNKPKPKAKRKPEPNKKSAQNRSKPQKPAESANKNTSDKKAPNKPQAKDNERIPSTDSKVLVSRVGNEKGLRIRASKTLGELHMRGAKNMLTPQNASLAALHPATLKKLNEISIKSKWEEYETPIIG